MTTQVQNPTWQAGKEAHIVLIGVKVEIPDWPGVHLLIAG